MKMKEQEEKKINLLQNIYNKCKYSYQGLSYCFKNESSFLLVAICASIIIVFGIIIFILYKCMVI